MAIAVYVDDVLFFGPSEKDMETVITGLQDGVFRFLTVMLVKLLPLKYLLEQTPMDLHTRKNGNMPLQLVC